MMMPAAFSRPSAKTDNRTKRKSALMTTATSETHHTQECLLVRYARKPVSLADIEATLYDTHYPPCPTKVTETREMTAAEYDRFVANPLKSYDWLMGKGGMEENMRRAIAITAPDRRTLYIDPSGYSYGRYIGMEVIKQNTDKTFTDAETAANYTAFVAGLTELTRRTGVAIKAIGGVRITKERGGFSNLVYEADMSSGDLWCRDLD
jgi:hypothetical protein